jgi:hypothetical protein
MAEEKSKLQIGEMLRHPIANVIIGFVLTGVLGTSLTQYYSMKRQQVSRLEAVAISWSTSCTISPVRRCPQTRSGI